MNNSTYIYSTIAGLRPLLACRRGTTMVLVGAMLPLILILLAVTVDIGRLYAVHTKAQNASDAALMGAVSTLSTYTSPNEFQYETERIFNANYPDHYMGSTVSDMVVETVGPGVYEVSYTVRVPTTILNVINDQQTTFNMLSQVTRGYEVTQNRRMELALVLDNTGSMADEGKIEALKQASNSLVDILFGSSDSLQNLHISIVPYDAMVGIGLYRRDWLQEQFVDEYDNFVAEGHGFVANRNFDGPINDYSDLTDDPPITEKARFRVPTDLNSTNCTDLPDPSLGLITPISFAFNDKASLKAAIAVMIPTICTRINVGLMWGWFTLSPKWQGIWDIDRPQLPASPDPLLDKAIVLMTDGDNTVFLGGDPLVTDDNVMTSLLCSQIKSHGITLYVIGLGNEVNTDLLKACATSLNHYWHAPSADELNEAFKEIADDIAYSTLRLSK